MWGAKDKSPILLSQYWKINNLKVQQKSFRFLGAPILFSLTVQLQHFNQRPKPKWFIDVHVSYNLDKLSGVY